MRILIQSAAEGLMGAYIASVEGHPSVGGMGNNMQEAVGACVMQNSHILGIETSYVTRKKTPENKKS